MNQVQITNFIDLAKQQLLKELLEKRVVDLDVWLNQCDIVWKEQHVLLPYPKQQIYPSEDEIVARAELLNKIHEETNKKRETNEKLIIETMVDQPEKEVGIIKINPKDQKSNTQNTKEVKLNLFGENLETIIKYGENK